LRKGRMCLTDQDEYWKNDLKLHPKAIGVIDRNKVNGSEWFPWKDKKQYEVFRRYQRFLYKYEVNDAYCCKSGSS
jgi:hypothetical protein